MATRIHGDQPRTGQQPAAGNQANVGSQAATAPPDVQPLPEVLERIRHDSRRDSRQYLDETAVPFGGE